MPLASAKQLQQNDHQPIVAIEIVESATHLGVYLEDAAGPRRKFQRLAVPPAPEELLPILRNLIQQTLVPSVPATTSPLRVGVAFWGHLDRDTGIVHSLRQNPRWQDYQLAERLSSVIGAPVTLETAINAAAWGEATRGAGVGAGTLLYIHLGQEISASVILDGQLLIKHSQQEGQFGHTTVAAEPRCQCGGYGHLSTIASAQSLVRTMIGRASDNDESLARLLDISGGRAEALTALQVVELATLGDAIAADILSQALDALALATANATLLFAPDKIIFGGAVVEAGETLLAPLRMRLDALLARAATMPDLRMGLLEPFAVLQGAYELAARDARQSQSQ